MINQEKFKKIGMNFCLILFMLVCLYGCGTNVFKSLGLVSTSSNQQEEAASILDNATTKADYQRAEDIADAILNDPTATDAQKQEAKYTKGMAILGKNGITVIDIASDFSNMTTGNGTQILDVLKSKVTGDVVEAAKLLNEAKSVSDNSKELTRGFANTMAVIDIVQDFYTIKPEGAGVSKNAGTSSKTALSTMVSSNITTNATEATNAFSNAGALSTDQKSDTDKLGQVSTDVASLNAAVNGQGTYTYKKDATTTVNITSSSSDTEIDDAMNYIFNLQK